MLPDTFQLGFEAARAVYTKQVEALCVFLDKETWA